MNIKRGPGLPSLAALKTAPQTDAAALCEALRCSRATLYFWRQTYNFPKAVRNGNASLTDTQAVAAWLFTQNVSVLWI
jgi:hypothetical protein